MRPLELKRIRVRNGALDVEVAACLDTLHVTSELAETMLGKLPNLARHVCVNSASNSSFGEEIVGTELPHLLEHATIELQAQAMLDDVPERRARLTGHTSWLEELDVTAPEGYALMRTTVSFVDDFVALRALNDALDMIEAALMTR